jgi:uncharacterized membrane protein
MHVVVDTEIGVPRRDVWEWIVDPERYRGFMEGITRWETVGRGPTGLGARISMRMRIGSAELGGLIEVVEFDPPCDLAWTSVTGVGHRGRWRLRAHSVDRTLVELRLVYHAEGGLMAYLADRAALPIVTRRLEHSLRRLKEQLETSRMPARIPQPSPSVPLPRP